MNKIIAADLYRYVGKTGTKAFIKAFFIPGFRFTFFLRKASFKKRIQFREYFIGCFYGGILTSKAFKSPHMP